MNDNCTLVTILMPCKNAKESFFKLALHSVCSQSSLLWNLIVINDHSYHLDTINILKELSNSNDNRISVIKNDSNLITGALNTGMKQAKTPYVCSFHCDDLLDNKTVEVLNRNIKSYPVIDYFYSSRRHIDEKGNHISSIYNAKEFNNLTDFNNYGPVTQLHCWKVESALAIGGMDESLGLHGADDYDFPWCMAEAGYTFKTIPECLYYYRDHREHYRLTTHVPLDTQIKELKKIWNKHGLTERQIKEQIKIRTSESGYLKQALYLDDQDKKIKENEGYDIRKGWHEKYR